MNGGVAMLHWFNRKELVLTFSMEEQARIRSILGVNGVAYYTKVVNHSSQGFGSRRTLMGTFGENQAFANQYIIYVHRKDYELAQHLVHRGS